MTISVSLHRDQVWLPYATSCFAPAKYLCSRHRHVGRCHLSITRVTHPLQCFLPLAMVGEQRACTVYRDQMALAPCLQAERAMMEKPERGEDQMSSLCPETITESLSVWPYPVISKHTAQHSQPWAGAEEEAGMWQATRPSLPFLHSLSPGAVTAMTLGSLHQDAWGQCCLRVTFPSHCSVTQVCP